ncbi:hypothetical protein QN372_20935 [Undibacterium sp. RTI2.1]|uniref:hypothetical protein n=1 Tax=unclassified Undibacterium TaxID=2630295 RepID=UPI002B22C4DB|nr:MULTISPECIES: hypothetical protein [unclassified Undibacterium]MEB0033206.1 hypothetical protein [Undibacterium sp. RTI2.1]MEB0119003.1 hypothetical protein [Undibacterium sp. RTI2.2]
MKNSSCCDPPLFNGSQVSTNLFTTKNQIDFFPDLLPPELAEDEKVDVVLLDIPHPANWSEQDWEIISIGLIAATWQNVVDIFEQRLKTKTVPKSLQKDYEATLGWLLGYWISTIPLELVLQYENSNQKNVYEGDSYLTILHALRHHPLIAADCDALRVKLCSFEMFPRGD